jgi:hypothetical protein
MKRSSILLLAATLVMSLGFTTTEDQIAKIYVYGDLLIRSNTADGLIEFFDLGTPATLPQLGAIRVTGNNDVAVVDEVMYADAGNDLIVYDISDVANIRALDTIHGVFRQLHGFMRDDVVPMGMSEDTGGMSGCSGCGSDVMTSPAMSDSRSGGAEGAGTAGSLARFAVAGEYLYCLDYADVIVFDIELPRRPQLKNRAAINWEIETLFPYGNTLFVGGQRGVYLVDITDGDNPTPISQFEHGRGCDPVVVENDIAYVTLRSGTRCGDIEDQLHILDVSNLQHPTLITSVNVDGPYGLAVRNGVVYLCDGTSGVKIIDASDPRNPRTIGRIEGIVAHDAILLQRMLIVTTPERAIIYALSDDAAPREQGSIDLR